MRIKSRFLSFITIAIILVACIFQVTNRVEKERWTNLNQVFAERSREISALQKSGLRDCNVLQLPLDTTVPTMPNSSLNISISSHYYSGLQANILSDRYVWTEGTYDSSELMSNVRKQFSNIDKVTAESLLNSNFCAVEYDVLKAQYLGEYSFDKSLQEIFRNKRISLYKIR